MHYRDAFLGFRVVSWRIGEECFLLGHDFEPSAVDSRNFDKDMNDILDYVLVSRGRSLVNVELRACKTILGGVDFAEQDGASS